MPADEVVATLRQAWTVLDDLRVPAALMGGLALAHWGHVRSTQDVDLLIALGNVRPQTLLARLAATGYRSKRRDPLIRLDDAGMIFMSTAFMQPEILAVKYDGKSGPEIAWRFGRQAPSIPSPLLVGDEVYIVSDKGIATCLDAHQGSVRWTERLAGNYAASPLFADGKIYFCNRDGLTTVLEPGTQYRPLGNGQLPGQILASPAAVGTALYIRTDQGLYRIEAPKP